MSKAAGKRIKRQYEYLVNLSFNESVRFDGAWEKRVDSWLDEIRARAREWAKGDVERWRVLFDIPDRADAIMRGCSPAAQRRHRATTFALLEAECARLVAEAMDPRMFRTNAMAPEWLEMRRYVAKG